jgi:hypothetical protein
MTVCLLALARGRFAIYSEPPEEPLTDPGQHAGRLRRWAHNAAVRWRDLVETARRGGATGWVARTRDALVCRLAETIDEQRTLWALRHESHATLLYPATLTADAARRSLDRVLGTSRGHHGLWLMVDALLFLVSAVLAPIPGPNAIAYYLAFRVVGHLQSWRGARHALNRVAWSLQPDENLAELAALVDVLPEARASRVADIAARLHLHRLSAYFERMAA